VQSKTRDRSAELVLESELKPPKEAEVAEEVLCRHSKKAGNSKESQQRLRKSSIQKAKIQRRIKRKDAILTLCNYLKLLRIA
jgi:hypothetical protein